MRKLTVFLSVLALLVVTAVPATAVHAAPVEGLWAAIDGADGSLMLMTIEEQNNETGLLDVVFFDTWATVACSPPSPFVARSSSSTYDDGGGGFEGRFFADLDPGRCLRRSSTPQIGAIEIGFFPVVLGTSMTDDFGNLWVKIGS